MDGDAHVVTVPTCRTESEYLIDASSQTVVLKLAD